MHNVGTIIRDLRKKHKHTLEQLGEKIDFNYSNLSKIERGERNPTFELLQALSELYDVPMSYFFREREQSNLLKEESEWYTVIKESEDKGYTPEEVKEIIQFVENIRKRN